jgi:hypothetical protein
MVQLTLRLEGFSQVVAGFGAVGLKGQRPLLTCHSLIQPALGLEDVT